MRSRGRGSAVELCPMRPAEHNTVRVAKGRDVGGTPTPLYLPDKSTYGQTPDFWGQQMDIYCPALLRTGAASPQILCAVLCAPK